MAIIRVPDDKYEVTLLYPRKKIKKKEERKKKKYRMKFIYYS